MSRKVISHKAFVRDLDRGAEGEEVVEKFFKEEFGLIARNVSVRNPDFDLIVDGLSPELTASPKVVPKDLLKKIFREAFGCDRREELTVEVKFDVAAAKYNNFFVEILFDIEANVPGTMFKCKADILAWVVPRKKKQYSIYLFKRPEFLAWLFQYIHSNPDVKLRTPAISPYARGAAVPIKLLSESFACLGKFDYTEKGEQ